MNTSKYTLTITYNQQHHSIEWDTSIPSSMEAQVSADVTDANVHQWFSLFQNILALAGHSERTIMDGACRLAFNEYRNTSDMQRLVRDFDLHEFMPRSPAEDEQPT